MPQDWEFDESLLSWAELGPEGEIVRASPCFAALWQKGPRADERERWPTLAGQFSFWYHGSEHANEFRERFLILPLDVRPGHYLVFFAGYIGVPEQPPANSALTTQTSGFGLLMHRAGEHPIPMAGDSWVLRCERIVQLVEEASTVSQLATKLTTDQRVGILSRGHNRLRWYHLCIVPIRLPSGDTYLFVWGTSLPGGVSRSTSEKLLQNQVRDQQGQLREMQSRLSRSVAEMQGLASREQRERTVTRQMERQTRLGHWVWHLDSGEVYWSDEINELLGLTVTQLNRRFQSFIDVAHPDDRAYVESVLDDLLSDQEEFDIEFRIERPDGVDRFVQATAEVGVSETGAPQMVGYVRDVTEQHNLAVRADAQSRQLEQANKMTALGTLVSGMAHEVNNPNSLILMNAGLLRQYWADLTPLAETQAQQDPSWRPGGLPYAELGATVGELLDDIQDGAERINKLVQDLRDYSRVTPEADSEVIDLYAVVQGALRLLSFQIRRYTAHLHVDVVENTFFVSGDPRQLEQVLVNLMLNALQALPNREAGVTVRTRREKDRIHLEVEDEGAGLDPDIAEHLFEPFRSTKLQSGGTGLGLSITERLVKRHGGSISLTARPQCGTLAVVKFPVVERDQERKMGAA